VAELERARREFHALAAAVAHALRTPLSALAGEVELALHRERTAESYRDTLGRIADRVAELDALTGDLAAFGSDADTGPAGSTGLSDLLVSLAPLAADGVTVEGPAADVRVAGDPQRLARALTLLVQHAARHRADGGCVRLRVGAPHAAPAGVELEILASPPRFPGRTWLHLEPAADRGETVNTAGLFRLSTAAHFLAQCGGTIGVECRDGCDGVRVRLRLADTDHH
jgi:two-component system heavy metal sensor histidine kinase CusS